MKIGIIIPDRGDRKAFTDNCLRMIKKQTLQPTEIYLVDYKPLTEKCDITQRYRIGYDYFRNKNFDVLAFIENDDWYHETYLETMVNKWIESGKPDLLGTNFTIYYNLRIKSYYTMNHNSRSSAMSTLIKPDMNFIWCDDAQPYTDSYLWLVATNIETSKKLVRVVFKPEKFICLGIKHGIGATGGSSHTTEMHRYKGNNGKEDFDFTFLKNILDFDSFNFYKSVIF